MNIASYVAFTTLAVTAIALWFPRRYFAVAAMLSAIALGYQGMLTVAGLAWMLLLVALCWMFARTSSWQRVICGCGIMLLATALGMHLLPGFQPITIVEPVVLSPGAATFKLQLSPDKILAGLIMAAMLWHHYIRSMPELRVAMEKAASLIVINVAALIALSITLGYLDFASKFTSLFFVWAAHNLLFTCIGEEIFFRGFIQYRLALMLADYSHGQWLALVISSVLFGLVHFGGGHIYVLLAAIAGCGYGYVFMKTQRIEMSILAHFIMNATHFLLFAYPRLQ